MIRVAIIGYSGRMGKALQAVAHEFPVEIVDPDLVIETRIQKADVVIDFSAPTMCTYACELASQAQRPFVSGTTGLTTDEHGQLITHSLQIPILHAANFSVGVNILEHLVELAARAAEGFDIEVFEAHHRNKVDAPGGTALMLGQAAARGRDLNFESAARLSREGIVGARPTDEIGFQVLRGGSIVGEHTVFLAGDGERLELTHRAQDRTIFARGAYRAALWILGRPAGIHTMRDVLFGA